MNIRLGLRDNVTTFRPGEIIEGAALWELKEAPEIAEVRLAWFTRGKGTEDGETVAVESFANPQPGDTRPFRLQLPAAPYSFSGRLIAVIWVVELVLKPGGEFDRVEITVAPDGAAIRLPEIPQPGKK